MARKRFTFGSYVPTDAPGLIGCQFDRLDFGFVFSFGVKSRAFYLMYDRHGDSS